MNKPFIEFSSTGSNCVIELLIFTRLDIFNRPLLQLIYFIRSIPLPSPLTLPHPNFECTCTSPISYFNNSIGNVSHIFCCYSVLLKVWQKDEKMKDERKILNGISNTVTKGWSNRI
jgi:hypothetical protein